ncbi:MAG TPA: cytochrome P450 [Acidimicrobiales bacterium]|nr:cytochrome P450 [Acidimicrobiales bacterium]
MAVAVGDLELPEIDLVDMDRESYVAALREAGRQHWLARTPLGYVVTRYAEATAVLREKRFHSALSLLPERAGMEGEEYFARRRQSILSMEGPDHARLRRLVAPAFTPRSADRLRPFMREVVEELIAPVLATGRCELVEDVCEPYPIPIICALLGAPREDWQLFSRWATDIFRLFNDRLAEDLPLIQQASEDLDAYVTELIAERRNHLGDDLLSGMIAAEEAGDRLSTEELVMMAEAVLMAGTDTTRNQLACSVALLAAHPDQWRLLGERPELAPRAVEETMRYLGAVRGTARFAAEDVELKGVRFPAGTFLGVMLAAANRDESVWPEPERLDITREPASSPQITFGSGIHFCLGASLARAELQEALPILARRMPDLEVDGEVVWKPDTVGIWGPARLPLRFAASAVPA